MATLLFPDKKKPKRRYRWTRAGEVEEWVKMIDDGMSVPQLARHLDRSPHTVRQYTQKWRREHPNG